MHWCYKGEKEQVKFVNNLNIPYFVKATQQVAVKLISITVAWIQVHLHIIHVYSRAKLFSSLRSKRFNYSNLILCLWSCWCCRSVRTTRLHVCGRFSRPTRAARATATLLSCARSCRQWHRLYHSLLHPVHWLNAFRILHSVLLQVVRGLLVRQSAEWVLWRVGPHAGLWVLGPPTAVCWYHSCRWSPSRSPYVPALKCSERSLRSRRSRRAWHRAHAQAQFSVVQSPVLCSTYKGRQLGPRKRTRWRTCARSRRSCALPSPARTRRRPSRAAWTRWLAATTGLAISTSSRPTSRNKRTTTTGMYSCAPCD